MRERVTITIDSSILERLDGSIDGLVVRNRSAAVERILRMNLSGAGPKKAIIMSGGRPILLKGKTITKSMAEVNSKPILYWIIKELRRNEIRNFIVCINDDLTGDEVVDYFGDGDSFGVKIDYLKSSSNSDSVSVVFSAMEKYGPGPFFVLNGDQTFRMGLNKMYLQHTERNAICTAALLFSNDVIKSVSSVKMEGIKVISFDDEKGDFSGLVNMGIYIFSGSLSSLRINKFKSIEGDLMPYLVKRELLDGFVYSGLWYSLDNDIPERSLKRMGEIVNSVIS